MGKELRYFKENYWHLHILFQCTRLRAVDSTYIIMEIGGQNCRSFK